MCVPVRRAQGTCAGALYTAEFAAPSGVHTRIRIEVPCGLSTDGSRWVARLSVVYRF
jgi:hypothetical protein